MTQTFIPGKDAALEDSIARFQQKLLDLGFDIEEASWLNPVPHVWSVHIRDKACALCFTNGKGATKKAALASALGEYFERLSTNYFFADFWLGDTIANGPFVHYPNEKWFPLTEDDEVPEGLLDARLRAFYDPDDQLTASMLVDLQSGNDERGVCGLPFTRQSDGETVYIPMNIVGNLYVSNGMSAGNTRNEARVQGLSEVFERHIKNRIIAESISLPEIPAKKGFSAVWPDLDYTHLTVSQTLDAVYTPYTSSLTDDTQTLPQILVDGSFSSRATVSHTSEPVSWTDAKGTARTGTAVTVTVDDPDMTAISYTVHYRLPEDGKRYDLWVKTESGWEKQDSTVDGSYLLFTSDRETVTFCVQERTASPLLWVLLAVLILLALMLVVIRIRKKRGRQTIRSRLRKARQKKS